MPGKQAVQSKNQDVSVMISAAPLSMRIFMRGNKLEIFRGKRDDIINLVRAGAKHHQPVDAQGDAGARWQ